MHHVACLEAVRWVKSQKKRDIDSLFKALVREKKNLSWGIWYLSRKLSKMDRIQWAIYAAKSVLHIYEERYPDDKRPRKAIRAAEKYSKNPSQIKRMAAIDGIAGAYEAAYAAQAAGIPIARATVPAAYATADAAYAGIYADNAIDACYAIDAVNAAFAATYARRDLQIKIIKYGIRLLQNK